MNRRQRLIKELNALEEMGRSVHLDRSTRDVTLTGFPLPDDWHPAETTVVFNIEPTYPRHRPVTFVKDTVRYSGRTPYWLRSTKRHGLKWVCMTEGNHSWDPDYHTLVSVARQLKQAMRHPHRDNPWTE